MSGLLLPLALMAGCSKSAAPDSSVGSSTQPPATSIVEAPSVSHVHWRGKKWIAAQTNAAAFMAILNLPESVQLEKQTLDKLATAPWRLLRGEINANPASARLRPLLDDVVQEESYLEIRQFTDHPAQIVFAIRLDAVRAALWQTNLAATVEALTGIRRFTPANGLHAWSLPKHDVPNLIQMTRAGDWTVLGVASATNRLLGEILARIERHQTPLHSVTTNAWLDADLDVPRVVRIFVADAKLPANTPRVTLAVKADGDAVRTEGDIKFPKPLTLELDAWNIPTNLVSDPLVGFTAIRGIRSWLDSADVSRRFLAGPPPNQLFLWTVPGLPSQTYIAAPLDDASNQVHALSARFMDKVNPLLATNDMGKFSWMENQNGIRAEGIPFISPFLRIYSTNGVDYAFAGTVPPYPVQNPPTGDIVRLLSTWTNLVYLDWEITGPRIVTWLYLSQLVRFFSNYPQIPPNSTAILWTKAVEEKLGPCDTMITKTDPDTLHFLRKSTIGFTALEINLLADWLESPQFPLGLHTFLAPPETPPATEPPPKP